MLTHDARAIYLRNTLRQSLDMILEYPLTIVEAPMGYGKTTAIREYLKNCSVNVQWHTVFSSSADHFWQEFSRLIGKIDPSCANQLAKIGVPRDNILLEAAIELIENIDIPTETVIVIDDYHLLFSVNTDRFFERLSQTVIPNLHIIIISRSVFGENTSELTLKGFCLVLDQSTFELSADEIVEYCKLCGIRLKTDEIAFLYHYTEGWISAVYLCICGYWQFGRLEQQSTSLHKLIEKIVYQPCPAEIQELLLTISVFDCFSLSQAEYMWEKGNADTLLAQLITENAFITFDHVNQIYHLHNILTSYLREIFDRQDDHTRQTIWKKAGEWYLKIGDYNQAMDFFYKAADFDHLLTTIETAKGMIFAWQPKKARISYFHECPTAIKKRHLLAGIIYAFNLFVSNEMELFSLQCRDLEHSINEMSDGPHRRSLMGELEVLKGITSFNNLSTMAGHFQAAWELMHKPSAFVDTKVPWTLGSPSVLYLYYRQSGQLKAEVQTITELPCYYRLSNGHGSGGEYMMEAEWHYYRGDFANAEIVAHKVLHIAKSTRQFALVICAVFLLMRLTLIKGDWHAVLNSLQHMRELLKQKALYSHIHILDLCEGFVFSCLDHPQRIPTWIAQGEIPDTLSAPSHGFYWIIWAKSLLIRDQTHQLIGVADQLITQADFFPNLLTQIYIHIFTSAAQARLWRQQEALSTLQKALDIAVPDQVIMPFVENSEYITDLLINLGTDDRYRDFIDQIRKISPPIIEQWRQITAQLRDNRNKQLTARESAIAELVAAGLSNQAIGKNLSISKDTVKKALRNIFIKLGVSNRTALTKVLIEQRAE